MKPITWIRLFLLCVVIGSFRAVEAKGIRFIPQEKTDTLINPPLMKHGDLKVKVTTANIVLMMS